MKNIIILICSLICISNNTLGYELETHASISTNAAKLSVLQTNPNIFHNLGLAPWGNKQLFPNGKGDVKTPVKLIGEGARSEDDTPRYFHHFYDPTNGLGLNGFWNGIPFYCS